jgi:hypothetical protein
LLLLDVDRVLNPFAVPACPPGYTEHEFFPGEEPVRVCAAHGPWLRELASHQQSLQWPMTTGEMTSYRPDQLPSVMPRSLPAPGIPGALSACGHTISGASRGVTVACSFT